MNIKEFVILVDENDSEIGLMEKQEAHRQAQLHRAFSIFIFNSKGQLLLQQRARDKYHSGGLWTNTCCSHPRLNETTLDAANRRLYEEMGFETELFERFHFIYHSPYENGLSEHELDYVYTGTYNAEPNINRDEVEDYRWISLPELNDDLNKGPENYTSWFRIIFEEYQSHLAARG
jgi:isopentenyl-diphosphate delta-isomerase